MDLSIFSQSVDLQRLAAERSVEYQSGNPYPHIVIDDLFDIEFLDRIQDVFPSFGAIAWNKMRDHNQVKLATNDEQQIPLPIQQFIFQLNSSTFLRFLEVLSGIDGLISDPHLLGGGLHMIKRGGKLNVHADFNRHPSWHLDRRLNLLVYLNKGWKDEYGGHFELWDREMKTCRKKVAPQFNRMVIFSTTDTSYHGHPAPLECPSDTARRSIALYYYSNGRPHEEVSQAHSTIFKRRPGDSKVKHVVRMFVPPIGYAVLDKFARR
jgi:hypothetical protein